MHLFSSLLFAQLVWIFSSSATLIAERVTIPAPIVVEPSHSFDGNDGPFSTFNISIGTPPQTVKVSIGTSVYRTLVVLDDESNQACPNLPDCKVSRGGLFSIDMSSTYQQNTANVKNNVYAMAVDIQLGIDSRAGFGFDNVALAGQPGISLKNQSVGAFFATKIFLGIFGLDPRPSNFSGDPHPIPSYISNLRDQSLIPSLSWGYSAGNQYRNKFGTLTLGGYDQSRFEQHDGSWPMDLANNLAVQLQSITWNNGKSPVFLLLNPITVVLDSALPYIWLPAVVCLTFEIEFGLTWDANSTLYLVNDTQHNFLLQKNASITFNLGGMTGGSDTSVNITLPYAAFDLTASAPLVPEATRYFPLKRAANETQYVIGRTFFQEAFVVADYERRNFSVYPCRWETGVEPDIQSIFSPSYGGITPVAGPGNSTDSPPPPSSKGKSNAGPIAGGVVGGLLLLAAVGGAMFYFCYWKPKRQHYTTNGEKAEMLAPLPENPALALDDPHLAKAELGNTQQRPCIPELEGSGGGPSHVFEMPVREEVAAEMRAPDNNVHEMASPDTMSEVTATEGGGYPWRTSLTEGGPNSPSPLGSPRQQSILSPVSSPSLGPPSPLPSPSIIPSMVPSPVPSPPPVAQPQPQRVVRPKLNTIDSSL